MTSQQDLLSEIARKLRKLECICANTAATSGIIIENYQPLDCDGDPVGDPIDVMPTISVAKQDVAICNTQELADAINGGSAALYDVATIEAASGTWALSDNNDISKVHSIAITIIGTPGGTADFSIGLGGTITVPVGFTYNNSATSVFNTDFYLANFVGGATAVISTTQSA